ncbi:MAG: porin [Alcaligenaceae bacterium]
MKKLTVLFILLIGRLTSAQAQDSITLYGIIDIGLQYATVNQTRDYAVQSSQFFGIASGVQSGSRFGLRGTHEMGGGFETVFTLENGFNSANGDAQQGSRLFGRQSTIGIKNNNIGQLDFGRQINLASNYFLPIDPFGEGFGQANIGASFGSANTVRYSNMVLFQAQATESLTLGAGYSFSTEMTSIYAGNGSCLETSCAASNQASQFQTNNNLRALTLGAKYSSGPLLLAVAYDQLQGPDNIPNGPPKPNPTAWLAGGLYDFSVIKISFAFGQARNGAWNGQPTGAGTTPSSPLADSTLGSGAIFVAGAASSSLMFGMTVPLRDGSLLASVQRLQPQGDVVPNSLIAPQMIYSAAYLYNFSRRTNLYTYASYGNHYAAIQTAQSTVVGVGLRHQF